MTTEESVCKLTDRPNLAVIAARLYRVPRWSTEESYSVVLPASLVALEIEPHDSVHDRS
jgi:hypothetical protein